MPLFIYRCPKTRRLVQGFLRRTSEDQHVYEPMTCPVCHQVHYVTPATGKILGEDGDRAPHSHAGGATLGRADADAGQITDLEARYDRSCCHHRRPRRIGACDLGLEP